MTCLLFAQTLPQWQEFVSQVGLPGFFMAAVLATMVAVLRWIAPQARTVFAAHVVLVRALTEAAERQSDFNRRQTEAAEKTARVLTELQAAHRSDSPASTLRTNRALHYAAHALYEVSDDDHKPAVRPYTQAMHRELGQE